MKYYLIPFIAAAIILPSCFQTNSRTNSYKNHQNFESIAKSLYVDFDTSMQTERYKHKINMRNKPIFSLFRHQYNMNSFNSIRPQHVCKIPKILHYIWLGKKLPVQYKPFLETWLANHPDWTFVFWVDNPENYDLGKVFEGFTFNDLKKYLNVPIDNEKRIVMDVKNLTFENRKFFDETRNYGQRSDILKWEVVYRFGGVYIDVDFESIKPLDMLNYMYDFYTGIQPLDTSFIQLGAALFAARPGHPILKHCVQTIKDDWYNNQIIVATGPLHFTKSYCAVVAKKENNGLINGVLPASYLYPCGYDEQRLPRKNWIKPESFAVHHWAGSWLKPEGWDQSS